jgi:hypothetical protein
METIRLEFQPNIKAKILELLSSFSSDELKIVQERETFEEEKIKLDLELAKINNGTAEFCSIEELDSYLDDIISEYEN